MIDPARGATRCKRALTGDFEYSKSSSGFRVALRGASLLLDRDRRGVRPGERCMSVTPSNIPLDRSIGAVFDQVAAHNPRKIAIEQSGKKIDFATLALVANVIAGRLLAVGALAAGRVALLFDDRI